MSRLALSLVETANATDLAVVAPAPSFGPFGVIIFFALLIATFVFLKKKHPDVAQEIERNVGAAFAWVGAKLRGLFAPKK